MRNANTPLVVLFCSLQALGLGLSGCDALAEREVAAVGDTAAPLQLPRDEVPPPLCDYTVSLYKVKAHKKENGIDSELELEVLVDATHGPATGVLTYSEDIDVGTYTMPNLPFLTESVNDGTLISVNWNAQVTEHDRPGGEDVGTLSSNISPSTPLSFTCSGTGAKELGPTTVYGSMTAVIGDGSQAQLTLRVTWKPHVAAWTPWQDRDDPSGAGDYETRQAMTSPLPCTNPSQIECQTTGGVDWRSTREVVTCDLATGGYCINSLQPDRSCMDYRVRYFCP